MSKKVLIDAGHGGKKPGAVRAGIYEKDLNLQVALLLEKALKKKKITTSMIRTKDERVFIKTRVDMEHAIGPDLFVSIHMNAARSILVRGHEVIYQSEQGQYLAEIITAFLEEAIPELKSRGPKPNARKLPVLKDTRSVAVVVECVFLSNEHDREWICKEKNRKVFVSILAEAICEYLSPSGEVKEESDERDEGLSE